MDTIGTVDTVGTEGTVGTVSTIGIHVSKHLSITINTLEYLQQ